MGDPYYITTPIYYVNDRPHIGHTYTTVIADTAARFQRQRGRDVWFLTGTDEHGQKVERAARQQGLKPIELADRVVKRYRDLWKRMKITNDDFIRTTEPRHRRAVDKLFRKIWDRGDIYLGHYEGWYCVVDEAFIPDSQVVDGCCDQGHPVEKTREESYFFRLSKFQQPLLRLYRDHPGFVHPDSRRNEVDRFVAGGLRDLSISRTTFNWGIPFPENDKHIFYVWFDALTNYLSALDFAGDGTAYGKYWPVAHHLVGKDILRFHAVYWPAFLMAADLPLPEKVIGHGWWLRDAGKMSKSRGNVVEPNGLIDDFGLDAVRYFLLREMVFGLDANYSDEALIDRVNQDLANDLGNLASRTLKLIDQNSGGKIPPGAAGGSDLSDLAATAEKAWGKYNEGFQRYAFHEGLAGLFELVGALNRFLVRREPWKLGKDPARRQELDNTLYGAAEGLRVIAVCLAPAVPDLAANLWRQLGCDGSPAEVNLTKFTWGALSSGQALPARQALFPRIDKKAYAARIGGNEKKAEKETEMPEGDRITFDQFLQIDLRVGKVLEAEKVPETDKLLKLVVDLGNEKRQVVAGIAERYDPSTLIGKQVILVANLKPAKIRGVESNGMVLAASVDGTPYIATFDEEVPLGARVR